MHALTAAILLAVFAVNSSFAAGPERPEPVREPDVFYAATPHRVVEEMLRMANVNRNDLIYDLGCGDGRIVIAAAERRGARGVGVEIDPKLVAEARANVVKAGVAAQVEIVEADLFTVDLKPATTLALYLLDSLNLRLRPKILAECRPGTRVIAYAFTMGAWPPDQHLSIATNGVSLWIVPANMTGTWRPVEQTAPAGLAALHLNQTFQRISGTAEFGGATRPIRGGTISGDRFVLVLEGDDSEPPVIVSGQMKDEAIEAAVHPANGTGTWSARRQPGTMRELTGGP